MTNPFLMPYSSISVWIAIALSNSRAFDYSLIIIENVIALGLMFLLSIS